MKKLEKMNANNYTRGSLPPSPVLFLTLSLFSLPLSMKLQKEKKDMQDIYYVHVSFT